MLKIKSYTFGTIANGVESLNDMLSGQEGKSRRIVRITGDIDADINLRAYRNNDQCVDIECNLMTTSAPWIDVDIPLAVGEIAKIGFYNLNAGNVTPTVAIAYEEIG